MAGIVVLCWNSPTTSEKTSPYIPAHIDRLCLYPKGQAQPRRSNFATQTASVVWCGAIIRPSRFRRYYVLKNRKLGNRDIAKGKNR